MTQADSVHSTPGPNTPIDTTRRHLLTFAAGGAVATAIPTAALAAAANDPDPAFALIAAHRAAEVVHCKVIDAQDETEAKYGIRSDEAWAAADRSGAMCDEINVIAWKLATTPPTTLAGVAAVLRFANEVEDAGGDWPDTDTIGAEGWHYQLRATMATAVEALLEAGKVRS
jgi:hypothetical protein